MPSLRGTMPQTFFSQPFLLVPFCIQAEKDRQCRSFSAWSAIKKLGFFMAGWLAFQFNPNGRYSRYKNQRLHRMGAVYLFVFPQHHFASLARFIHIDNALIRRTPETQGDVMQAVDIGAIHQHVNQA